MWKSNINVFPYTHAPPNTKLMNILLTTNYLYPGVIKWYRKTLNPNIICINLLLTIQQDAIFPTIYHWLFRLSSAINLTSYRNISWFGGITLHRGNNASATTISRKLDTQCDPCWHIIVSATIPRGLMLALLRTVDYLG